MAISKFLQSFTLALAILIVGSSFGVDGENFELRNSSQSELLRRAQAPLKTHSYYHFISVISSKSKASPNLPLPSSVFPEKQKVLFQEQKRVFFKIKIYSLKQILFPFEKNSLFITEHS